MNRRNLISALCTLPLIRPAFAEQPDWKARLISGNPKDGRFTYGLHIMLAPGWKTYWRVPGDAGIPPQINASLKNFASWVVDYPMPIRINDESGEAIGYHDEVVFLLNFRTADGKPPADLKVSSFFGVCKEICKPAKFDADGSSATSAPELIEKWQARLPAQAKFIETAAFANDTLTLTSNQPLDDVFVEGPGFFHKPVIDGKTVSLKYNSYDPAKSLKGIEIVVTAAAQGKGLEQKVTVA